jgi:ribosomal-protein-alanine N-acetyltransferase
MEAKRIVIRDLRPTDVAAIIQIQHASPQMAQWKAADYEKLARNPHGVALVAESSGGSSVESSAVTGFLAGRAIGDEAEIQNLAVRADQRRQGIASALIEETHQRLTARGVRNVFLEVRRSNAAARTLYGGLGYTECGLRRRYYVSDGEDALVLRRELAPAPEESD